jgi:outer membrane murein-binding lipoprotein Lpp
MGDDMKALADGLRELMNTVNNLGTKLDDMAVTVKDLSAKVDRLSPLVPVASNLAALPEKVTALQASAYDNTQQVRALNLAVIRVEKAQRKGKAPVEEEDSALDSAANDPPPQGRPKPPPFAG